MFGLVVHLQLSPGYKRDSYLSVPEKYREPQVRARKRPLRSEVFDERSNGKKLRVFRLYGSWMSNFA
eukprot:jgi/Botrbrau1/12169/Bobra.0186s0077.1